MGNSEHDLLRTAFFGPWVPQPGKNERVRHHYMSLAHWYECAKFMPAHPELRDGVLFCPTAKEARKFAKARQAQWHANWNLVRHQVLIAGLGFLSIDRPDLDLANWPDEKLQQQLASLKLPDWWTALCITKFKEWATGPRIGTYGAHTAPSGIVGKKMSKVVQNKPTWTLVSLCNSKAAWKLHDWSLSLYIPVQYVGTPQSRNTSTLLDEMVSASDQLVVFEVKGGKNADGIIKRARGARVTLTLELYSPEDLSTANLA